MKFIRLTASGRRAKEYYFKPQDFVFISVESGKTHVHLYFDRIGFKEIMVEQTPEEIQDLFADAMNN